MTLPFAPLSVRILNEEETQEILRFLSISLDNLPRCSIRDALWRWVTPEGEPLSRGKVVRIERDNQGKYPYTYRLIE